MWKVSATIHEHAWDHILGIIPRNQGLILGSKCMSLIIVLSVCLGEPGLGTGCLSGSPASYQYHPIFSFFYPLWVALGKDPVCISICQIDQEGAAWQWGQAVFDGEVHSCLQGLSILSQHCTVIFPLSAGRKETDRGFTVCHFEVDGKMRTCHSSIKSSPPPQPISNVSRENRDRTSLGPHSTRLS